MWDHNSSPKSQNSAAEVPTEDEAGRKIKQDGNGDDKAFDLGRYLRYLDGIFRAGSRRSDSSDDEWHDFKFEPENVTAENSTALSNGLTYGQTPPRERMDEGDSDSDTSDVFDEELPSSMENIGHVPILSDYRVLDLIKIHKSSQKATRSLGSLCDVDPLIKAAYSRSITSAESLVASSPSDDHSTISSASKLSQDAEQRILKEIRPDLKSRSNSTILDHDRVRYASSEPRTPQSEGKPLFRSTASSPDHMHTESCVSSGSVFGMPGMRERSPSDDIMQRAVPSLGDTDTSSQSSKSSLQDIGSVSSTTSSGKRVPSIDILNNSYKPPSVSSTGGKLDAAFEDDIRCVEKDNKSGKSLAKQARMIEAFNVKRRKIYVFMCKKEIAKTQIERVATYQENLIIKKKLAEACSDFIRQKVIASRTAMNESKLRAKRLTSEMLAYWKRVERNDRELLKQKEKAVEEQRRLNLENVQIEQRKKELNLLLTWTELFSHSVSKKFGMPTAGEESLILKHLETKGEDSEKLKKQVISDAQVALQTLCQNLEMYESLRSSKKVECVAESSKAHKLSLKRYQQEGVTWLKKHFENGLNCILADDRGLGKTLQTSVFLSEVATSSNVWGPFLIVTTSSSIARWQHELERAEPRIQTMSYSGHPQDRNLQWKIWQDNSEDVFHVLVTSYQVAIADIDIIRTCKWQHVVFDTPPTSGTKKLKWRTLLRLACRSRTLLSSDIYQLQNEQMHALMLFLQPASCTSAACENILLNRIQHHASIDSDTVSRLNAAMKAFMLRRSKLDVETELPMVSEEVMLCPFSDRQLELYEASKKKIRIEDMMRANRSMNLHNQPAQHSIGILTNSVIRLRKICDHPDLVECRHDVNPFQFPQLQLSLPSLVYHELIHSGISNEATAGKIRRAIDIFESSSLYESLHASDNQYLDQRVGSQCAWSFLRLIDMSISEFVVIMTGSVIDRWQHMKRIFDQYYFLSRRNLFKDESEDISSTSQKATTRTSLNIFTEPYNPLNIVNAKFSSMITELLFVDGTSAFCSHEDCFISWPGALSGSCDTRTIGEDVSEANCKSKRRRQELLRECKTFYPPWLFTVAAAVESSGIRLDCNYPAASSVVYTTDIFYRSVRSKCRLRSRPHHFVPTPSFVMELDAFLVARNFVDIPTSKKDTLMRDSGKLVVLDKFLPALVAKGHVLICSQVSKMIEILSEHCQKRRLSHQRLDLDVYNPNQGRSSAVGGNIVFLISNCAVAFGVSLPSVKTVVFYDSDWNLSDQTVVDRLRITSPEKQINVYRLLCRQSIEEMSFHRTKEKSGEDLFKFDVFQPRELVSLLLEDEDIERRFRQKQTERSNITNRKTVLYGREGNNAAVTRRKTFMNHKFESLRARRNLNALRPEMTDLSDDDASLPADPSSDASKVTRHRNLRDANGDDHVGYSASRKVPRLRRGTGKRGRPPTRIRIHRPPAEGTSSLQDGNEARRGPGRPRLKPIGPLNQGERGRRPGRPPLSRKPPSVHSGLTPLTASQRVFGFYSSSDVNMVNSKLT